MPKTKHFDDLLVFANAINNAVGMMDDFSKIWIGTFGHNAAQVWMILKQLQFFQQRQTEAFSRLWIVTSDEPHECGQILIGQFGYEDFESHVWRFFSTCSSGMTLP